MLATFNITQQLHETKQIEDLQQYGRHLPIDGSLCSFLVGLSQE